MYSVLGRRTIALRKMHLGNVIHTYDNVHRYPPLSDLFVDFGFTKGPPLIHSIHPNTFVHVQTTHLATHTRRRFSDLRLQHLRSTEPSTPAKPLFKLHYRI